MAGEMAVNFLSAIRGRFDRAGVVLSALWTSIQNLNDATARRFEQVMAALEAETA